MRVVLASRNTKKLAELRRILVPHIPGIEVLGLDDVEAFDEPAETEPTFAGNALIKARACLQVTGLPSLADDSGLCVDALNGMPGVLSARWSGDGDQANNDLLLRQIGDVPDDRRTAQFRCAVALCVPDGIEIVEHGEMAGRILRGPRGEGGFGYDPLFAADGYDVSTAELPPQEKDLISHRGKALRAIAPYVLEALRI
ncbi:MAG: RdgB/HAM1 family non-canonical purine NTP pyrophosphatase [Actinomycetota bacterium]|nr:RdgB/HAM1 family non-canonical purine NTP pyrophosphatase [Actinomycetota bacterium]